VSARNYPANASIAFCHILKYEVNVFLSGDRYLGDGATDRRGRAMSRALLSLLLVISLGVSKWL